MTTRMPKPGEPIADRLGRITPSWRDYFRRLAGADSLDAVWQAIEDLRIAPGEELSYRGAVSILVSNVDGVVTVSLRGDADSPGGRYYYGTNASGIKGWWPVAEAVTGGGSLTSAVDYGPYNYQGELDTPDELPYPVVVGDAYLINGDLWVGADDGGDDGPGWDNIGPAPTTAVLALENDEATPDPAHYYGTDEAGVRGYHQRRLDTLADVDAPSPSPGQVLAYTGSEWAPATNLATGVFNYISADGDIYASDDGDLYIGV